MKTINKLARCVYGNDAQILQEDKVIDQFVKKRLSSSFD